ncbi:molybdate ABC transporter substrate-binding protein [Blastochloris viridis]|uniref:Molybdate-binding periplasmic protein n=1 Tax=Blastochloris viridis TaxID=1079 RepID=A0A0H5BD43_BLAVI|nr:molybdate ABC transporter substrate-binding protein [Blastochloris viridis]ALK08490.1 Molybdate-binding periplasmic protein precursor [Blastochloris viridis]BAR98226.1 molybdenum ABC transporter [Blastochloris viridis]CUU41152.1 Molybdate-binding periplasmic protein precursor [Blastochloris viridis]
MPWTTTRRRLAALAFAGLAAVAIAPRPAAAEDQKPVLVFAAASLTTAFNAIGAAWEKETGKKVSFSYAASSALARQMESGAPADLFVSADLRWMNWASEKKLIKEDTRETLLGNALVLIAPLDATTDLKIAKGFPLAKAIGDSRLATGAIPAVPVGNYAKQALTNLGVWADIEPRIAGAESVRAALALVARGEAQFGIVYSTDAKSEPKVKVVDTFPADSHDPVLYPIAITANSANPDAAEFLAYLRSPTAETILTGQGFTIVPKT